MQLDNYFINKTLKYLSFLQETYQNCLNFDKLSKNQNDKTSFILNQKLPFKTISDKHYEEIWSFLINNIPQNTERYTAYKTFYYQQLSPLLLPPAVNWQINKKPFGYPGDFVVMNYIYALHDSSGNFLGNNSFEILVNNYTCNIPIATSNIERKNFFKDLLIEANKSKNTKVASIACGPMRELFDALKSNCTLENITFYLFDFEDKVFDYLKTSIEDLSQTRFNYHFIKDNIVNLIRNKNLKTSLANQNIIYCSGLFDYLNDSLCYKLLQTLFDLLTNDGSLIFCNASEESSSHRAYYEFLGDWHLLYRNKNNVETIINKLKGNYSYQIFKPSIENNYWFAKIVKK